MAYSRYVSSAVSERRHLRAWSIAALFLPITFVASLWSSPALSQSGGCNALDGGFNVSSPGGGTSGFIGFPFDAGDQINLTYTGDVQPAPVELGLASPGNFDLQAPLHGASGSSISVTLTGTMLTSGSQAVYRTPASLQGNWTLTSTCIPISAIPALAGISPDSGDIAGGNEVTITGTNFRTSASVLINGTALPAGSVTFVSSTEIRAEMPPSPSPDGGAVQVEVSTEGGISGVATYTYLPPTDSPPADSREDTLDAIASFMDARAGVLLANQPDIQRRIDRLNGVVGGGNPVASLMAYMPGLVESGALSMSGSFAQVERLAGNETPSRFDLWASLTHGHYSAEAADGNFTLGSIGADYLINRDLLVGAFVQIDRLSQDNATSGASADGTGWLAGPYVTTRLAEHVFLDILAAGGRSSNSVSPYGTYEDDFAATRFIASAALQGHWTSGAWTFGPRARLSWFRERSDAYVDSLGVAIPSVRSELGQFAVGPGLSYRFDTETDVVIETGIRFDAVADFARNSHLGNESGLHGRVEGSVDFGFSGGARLSLSAAHDGIGRSGRSTTVGKISLAIPLN